MRRTAVALVASICAACASSAPGASATASTDLPDAGFSPPDAGSSQPPDAVDGGTAVARDGGSPPAGAGPLAFCPVPGPSPSNAAETVPGLSTSCESLRLDPSEVPAAADFGLGTMGANCRGATSDATGTAALLFNSSGSTSYQPYAIFRDGDAGLQGGATAAMVEPQPSGFAIVGAHADLRYGYRDSFFHFSFSEDPPPLVNDQEIIAAAPPSGGALVAQFTWNLDKWFIGAARFDRAGRPLSSPLDLVEGPLQQGQPVLAVAVATGGDGLVGFSGELLGDPGSVYGIWVLRDGSSDRRPIQLAQAPHRRLLLRPLADGSIAVGGDGTWLAQARPSGEVEPAPPWLAALSGHDVLLRASGSGYVVPSPGSPDRTTGCAPFVQLRAPAGNLCATVGLQHQTADAYLGLDGTLFARFYGLPCDFGLCCHLRWWKGALP
jgi:hypothetical protein